MGTGIWGSLYQIGVSGSKVGVGDGGRVHCFAGVAFLDADEVAEGVVFNLLPFALGAVVLTVVAAYSDVVEAAFTGGVTRSVRPISSYD
ncbi:MAG: hypothetical protein ACK55F_12265 [Acidobacteriota bacterium]